MPIDAQTALAAGAIDFGSTDPDNFASLFKADAVYRIASYDLGQDSAVVGTSPTKELLVNPEGAQDPRGHWTVRYLDGHIIEHASIKDSDSGMGTLYANADGPKKEVFLGYGAQPFKFMKGPGGTHFVWIQDKKSGLVWERSDPLCTEHHPVILRPQDNGPRQLWAFIPVG